MYAWLNESSYLNSLKKFSAVTMKSAMLKKPAGTFVPGLRTVYTNRFREFNRENCRHSRAIPTHHSSTTLEALLGQSRILSVQSHIISIIRGLIKENPIGNIRRVPRSVSVDVRDDTTRLGGVTEPSSDVCYKINVGSFEFGDASLVGWINGLGAGTTVRVDDGVERDVWVLLDTMRLWHWPC